MTTTLTNAPNPASGPAEGAPPLAVIDIGSNSGRVVVVRCVHGSHIDVLEDVSAPLRLVQSVDDDGRLSDEAVEHAMEVLRDFRAVALSAGAAPVVAVATAAIREARNGEAVAERIRRELGFELQVITAEQEAQYAFWGATSGLPVTDGLLVDVGGGSVQVVQFRDRAYVRSWSMPLGALRLSGKFLEHTPPTKGERSKLESHVRKVLDDAKLPKLLPGESLVGTGGTIRNLAKIDRRAHNYPIHRLHGYALSHPRLFAISRSLQTKRPQELQEVPGLNDERVDSIVGGALMLNTLLATLGGPELLVSGLGLREGVALERLVGSLPSPEASRRASVSALTARFATWHAPTAQRRAVIARALAEQVLTPVDQTLLELLEVAASVLDIGNSIDHYNRHDHAADILMETDLNGFSHHAIGFTSAVVYLAGNRRSTLRKYLPLLNPADEPLVRQLAAVLDLADEAARRLKPGVAGPLLCERRGETVVVRAPLLDVTRLNALAERHAGALGPITFNA